MGTNASWPFVTIPAFEALAARVMEQTGSETMTMIHYVMEEQRDEWETYTQQNGAKWIEESYRYYENEADAARSSISPFITGNDFGVPTEGPAPGYNLYAPVWQNSPLWFINGVVNYDTMK